MGFFFNERTVLAMAGINMNRTTEGVVLPAEVSSEIWGETVNASAVMSAARQITLPGAGIEIPIITGEPEAGWVNETDEKPVSEHTLASKKIQAYKLAVIELFSDEFVRDLPGLYRELVRRLPYALGRKFDQTVFGEVEAPGDNFDTLKAAPTAEIGGGEIYQELVGVYGQIAAAGGTLSHWLAGAPLQGVLLGATDGFGRPLFTPDATTANRVGQMLGAPIVATKGLPADAVGFAGDFADSAVWGQVEGIKLDMSDQATVVSSGQTISTWQRNMVAVRAEVEVGFRVVDDQRFTKLTKAAASGLED